MHLSIRVCLTLLTTAFIYINVVESAGPNDEYVIWPKDHITPQAVDSVTALIASYADGTVYTSSGEPYSLVLYWSARLPKSAIQPIEGHYAVRLEYQNLPQS